jgi:acyl carrier protein
MNNANTTQPAASLRGRLYATIESTLGVPAGTVQEDSSPETIASWDSLNHLNLVMAVESEFGISLSPQDVVDMRNVALIRTILREYGVDVE